MSYALFSLRPEWHWKATHRLEPIAPLSGERTNRPVIFIRYCARSIPPLSLYCKNDTPTTPNARVMQILHCTATYILNHRDIFRFVTTVSNIVTLYEYQWYFPTNRCGKLRFFTTFLTWAFCDFTKFVKVRMLEWNNRRHPWQKPVGFQLLITAVFVLGVRTISFFFHILYILFLYYKALTQVPSCSMYIFAFSGPLDLAPCFKRFLLESLERRHAWATQ